MTEAFQKQIEQEARQAVTELLAEAKLKKRRCVRGRLLVQRDRGRAHRQAIPAWKRPAPCMQALPRCWPKTASGWQRSAVSI